MNYPNQHTWQQATALIQNCECGASYGYEITKDGQKQIAIRLWEKCTKVGA